MEIIKIDRKNRIKIEPNNYVLENYKTVVEKDKKTKKKVAKKAWVLNGYFGDMTSLLLEYLNNAPRTYSMTSIKNVKELITVIQKAEAHIIKVAKNIK